MEPPRRPHGAHACTHVPTSPHPFSRGLSFGFHEMCVDSQIGIPGTQPKPASERLRRRRKQPEKERLCDPFRCWDPLAGGRITWKCSAGFTQGFPSLGERKSPAPKGETDSSVTCNVDGSLLCFAQTFDLWESQ